ncbi:MAG: M23 family metallopeptidase [Sphingomonadales bacterium]
MKLTGSVGRMGRNQVIRQICRRVCFGALWQRDNDTSLRFKTKLQVKALKGLTNSLSSAEKKVLGLTTASANPILLACAKGCAGLINSGAIATPKGKDEHQIILAAVQAADAPLAKRLAANKGSLSRANPTTWPVRNPVITSGFGQRNAPVSGASTFHDALDFRAPLGEPILSTEDGTVFSIGNSTKAGNHIFIRNHDFSMSSYSHTRAAPGLSAGQRVKAGQKIGESDGSGSISGAHLHYTYRRGNAQAPATPASSKVNPLTAQFQGMSL